MKIIELKITNVRGIRELQLKPDGNNLVVWGPNGTGKSAVIDAIDFLLTGSITRLTGQGTGHLSVQKHGPHVDISPEKASVEAVIQPHSSGKHIRIKRCMDSPTKLEYKQSEKKIVEPIQTLAKRGQHVLTRREILAYITTEPGNRAKQIQTLLNLSDIESVRKSFVSALNSAEKAIEASKRNIRNGQSEVSSNAQIPNYDEIYLLKVVNENRALLGGQALESLSSSNLQSGLNPPTVIVKDNKVNTTLLESHIQKLEVIVSKEKKETITKIDQELRTLIASLQNSPELLHSQRRKELLELGQELLENSGECPLCGTKWPPGELEGHLKEHIANAQATAKQLTRCRELSGKLIEYLNNTSISLKSVLMATKGIDGVDELIVELQKWQEDIAELTKYLNDFMNKYPSGLTSTKVSTLLAPEKIVDILQNLLKKIQSHYPKSTPEQTAWDLLTKMKVSFQSLENSERQNKEDILLHRRIKLLSEQFQLCRDRVLGKLYDKIRDRFVELYRMLHAEDEDGFNAILKPDGAGLNLEVDFHGRGPHPPHALHSEGHQDSMGLCLYLALSEHLTQGVIDLVLLDDVVMSVDANHRRELCSVIRNAFPDRQFVITTHDKTWETQLKTGGVVKSKQIIHFYSWHVDSGPSVNDGVDMWQRISVDIEEGRVSDASAKLRRGSEEFFSQVCQNIRAQVEYKANGQYTLGELVPNAYKRLKGCIESAKKAAVAWSDEETKEALDERLSTAKQIYSRTQAEQWGVNATVHYNEWANLSTNDFLPIVESFQDLFGLFTCPVCEGTIYVSGSGPQPDTVRCGCNKICWNLKKRK